MSKLPITMAASVALMVPVLTIWRSAVVKLAPSTRMPSASSPVAMMVPLLTMPARSTMSTFCPLKLVVASMAVAPLPVTWIRPLLISLPSIRPPSRLMPLALVPLAMMRPVVSLSRSPLIVPVKSSARATSISLPSSSGSPVALSRPWLMTLPLMVAGSIIRALEPPPTALMLPLLIRLPSIWLLAQLLPSSQASRSMPPAKSPLLLIVVLRIRSPLTWLPLNSIASSAALPV